MLTVGEGRARTCAGVTRRDLLRVGGVGALGLTLADLNSLGATGTPRDRSIVLLMLVGGPSQLETWDPKPKAPIEVRGPFGSIATSVPGVRINEHLPRLAHRLDHLTVIRSLHHDAAPIHETGHQLIQTGKLARPGHDHPHVGAVLAQVRGVQNGLPPFVVVPGPIGNTGVGVSHGQTAGPLGESFEPFHLSADPGSADYDAVSVLDHAQRFLDRAHALPNAVDHPAQRLLSRQARAAFDLCAEPESLRDVYGRTTFGQSCLLARRLVEAGVRLVTVNMFESVFNRVTWDCHGSRPFSTLDDYAHDLLPTLDMAFSALIDDLENRGLLDSTLVVATGEFGRTPRLNAAGGRDHWPGVWSAVLAGGGTCGGQVIGASNAEGGEPADRPVTPGELVATMYRSLGIDATLKLDTAQGSLDLLAGGAKPVLEAFA